MSHCIFIGREELDDDGELSGAYEYAFFEHCETDKETVLATVNYLNHDASEDEDYFGESCETCPASCTGRIYLAQQDQEAKHE